LRVTNNLRWLPHGRPILVTPSRTQTAGWTIGARHWQTTRKAHCHGGQWAWCPIKSGRLDSNQRPHGPEPCALAKLSYAPWFVYRNCHPEIVNGSDPKCPGAVIRPILSSLPISYHGGRFILGSVAKTDTFSEGQSLTG